MVKISSALVALIAFLGPFGQVAGAKENGPKQIIAPPILAQAGQVDLVYNQMGQSMDGALQEILPFLSVLSQLEQVQTDEQLLALTHQLRPMATRITTNFSQAYQAGELMLPLLPAGTVQTEYLGTIVTLNGLGALAFSPWQEIFTTIEQAYAIQNTALLQTAIGQIPQAAEKLNQFAGQFQMVVQQGQQIQAAQVTAPNNLSVAEAQMMSNMSRMMHETNMDILNNMGSDGEWRLNYGTGQQEYQYY
ncbi:hypothetical protein IQE94_09630 [Synechocystis sp. PCC 7339]|uniref:hypothetical protein n=1 Tax=Synechocystis sp. PCC 7339 TaxID=2782213 RepID=UPI001CBF0384|nr:hypothetical protein [Synechocystis sp. PCC 7339]UAJ71440.1 hypothetical protein IQE94_09630 [Synechocystis sp. PCC 7339]